MASDSGPNAMCETGGFDVGPVTLAIRPGIGNSEAYNTEDMTHSELVMLDEIGDNYRVGVGLSIVETLLVAIERLNFQNAPSSPLSHGGGAPQLFQVQ